MIHLHIEYTLTGPLSNPATLGALENACMRANSLDEAKKLITDITGVYIYVGGNHIAVHPGHHGRFANGSQRLAIITA